MPGRLLFNYKSHAWLFCDTIDCSLPGSSVRLTTQARILEWVAIYFFNLPGIFNPQMCFSPTLYDIWAMWTMACGKSDGISLPRLSYTILHVHYWIFFSLSLSVCVCVCVYVTVPLEKSNYHHRIIRKFLENSAWHMARELKIQPIANDKLKPENHKMNELGNKSYPIWFFKWDCGPCQQLKCNLMRELEPEPPS